VPGKIDGATVGLDARRIVAERDAGTRQQKPAGQVVGMRFQMVLQFRERRLYVDMVAGIGGIRRCVVAAVGERPVGQGRGPELRVEQQRCNRQQQDRHRRGGDATRVRDDTAAACPIVLPQRQDAAADFGAGRLRLFAGKDAARRVALDFAELVAVDGEIVRIPRSRAAGPQEQRQQQRRDGERGHCDQRDRERKAHDSAASPMICVRRCSSSRLSGAAVGIAVRRR